MPTPASFNIDVDQLGHATVHIGDQDWTEAADGGIELVATPNQPTVLRLLSLRPGRISGEGLVETWDVSGGSAADAVRELDADQIRAKVAATDADMDSDPTEAARDAIAALLDRR